MTDVRPILLCNYVRSTGHIDETKGIFGILSEAFRRIVTGNLIPALNNTRCACRGTKHCNVNCPSAVSAWIVSGKIAYRNIGSLM